MNDVAILFVRSDSVYKTLPGCDCYDEARDARTWQGRCTVVAHPPCRTWSRMKAWARAPEHEHALAIWAVAQVRRWGGVLEHPAASDLWKEAGLPAPGAGDDAWGGWTLECDQFHWGHLCQKRTRLYIVGVRPNEMPPMPHRDGEPTHCVSSLAGRVMSRDARHARDKFKPEIGPRRRDISPPLFAEWLVAVARVAAENLEVLA